LTLPQPDLGDLGHFIAALALGAMGKMQVPGQEVPVDHDRARWLIGLLEVLINSLSADVAAEQRTQLEQLLTQLRMAAIEP
jgi:hypothetical protein